MFHFAQHTTTFSSIILSLAIGGLVNCGTEFPTDQNDSNSDDFELKPPNQDSYLPGIEAKVDLGEDDVDPDVDDCVDVICHNGGECIDGIDTFTCQCPAGFTGTFCEINTTVCVPIPCEDGEDCQGEIKSYSCTCAPGFSGPQCDQPTA